MQIYQVADHRNEADINATWQQLITSTHSRVAENQGSQDTAQQPYEAIITVVKDMADRLNRSETTFSPTIIVPMIEQYAVEFQNGVGSRHWVPDLFMEVGFSYESIVTIIQGLWYNNLAPFTGRNRNILAEHIIYVCSQWYENCITTNTRLFGSDDNAQDIGELLEVVGSGLGGDDQQLVQGLRRGIQRGLR